MNYNLTAGLDRIAALDTTIFVAYGGHAQAAGFTINPKAFPRFTKLWMADIIAYTVNSADHSSQNSAQTTTDLSSLLNKPWVSDARLTLEEITLDFVRHLEHIGPFGIGFAKPIFTLSLDKLPMIEALGGSGEHIKLVGPKGVKINGFGLGKHNQKLSEMRNMPVELLVEVDRETWQGRESVVISVRDMRKKV